MRRRRAEWAGSRIALVLSGAVACVALVAVLVLVDVEVPPGIDTIASESTVDAEVQVLGDSVLRRPVDRVQTTTSGAPSTSTSTSTTSSTAPEITPAPATSALVTTSSTTTSATSLVCRNSTDPNCGPLSWSPRPDDQQPVVTAGPAPRTLVVGQEHDFAVQVDDPDGATAEPGCVSWQISDSAVPDISSCGAVTGRCQRYGPHDPPPPTAQVSRQSHRFAFETPGDHTVTVRGTTPDTLDDGCPNPYSSTWSHTFTVTVVQDGSTTTSSSSTTP